MIKNMLVKAGGGAQSFLIYLDTKILNWDHWVSILEVVILLMVKMTMNNSFRQWWFCQLISLVSTFLHVSFCLK